MTTTTIERRGTEIALPPLGLFVGGEWRDAEGGATFELTDPATEQSVSQVASASATDVDAAVAAAREAFDGGEWSRLSGPDRRGLLLAIADLLEEQAGRLAALEALDIGKPVHDAGLDIGMAVETFRHFAGWADRINGSTVPLPDFLGRPRFSYTVRDPVGVVGAITPWNAPTMIGAWKVAAALATGCTVVLKPPEDAPLSTLLLAELVQRAGVPAGALNVVPGLGPVAGAALCSHLGVDKVSFTGSPQVGAEIARLAGPAFRRVTLELGGKSPQIVFADADLELAVPQAAVSLFANQGETCAAGTRVLVQSGLVDDVLAGLSGEAQRVRLGDPFSPDTTMGSLINGRQAERVLGYIKTGQREGAQLHAGGHRLDRPGFFVEPTIFSGHNDLTIAREEIFGPVGTVIPFEDEADALKLANATRYGLAAVVYTRDLARAHRAAAALRVGAVWVNAWGPPDPRLPWGGTRTSGIGRELGEAGIAAYVEDKAVSIVL